MIIPNFKCHQDNEYVYIEIKASNSKLELTQFDLSENVVIFTSPPYHLRLNLPGNVITTDEDDNCRWNSDSNEFVLKLKKLNVNEHFEGLDLISKLLTLPKEDDLKMNKNLIEIIDQNDHSLNGQEDNLLDDQKDKCLDPSLNENIFDENFEFIKLEQETRSLLDSKYKYGFLNDYSNVIERYQDDIWQLSDCKNPGDLSVKERKEQRLKKETNDFDEEYYLFDQYENHKFIENLRLIKSEWLDYEFKKSPDELNESDKLAKSFDLDQSLNQVGKKLTNELRKLEFTDDEIFKLKSIPKKEFTKLTKEEKIIIVYGLVDVLFGYCYDKRINQDENTSESAWNVCKLSSTLSWFDSFWQVDDLINSCIRRSLCYPLYRNFELSKSVFKDVIKVLRNGQIHIIKCLLEIHKLLNEYGNFKYLLNNLYINDYLIIIQFLDKKYFNRLADLIELKISSINKDSINLDLVLLDKAAESTILEQIENLDC